MARERELRCFRCGYDLRGLAEDRRCPECGMEIGETLLALSQRRLRSCHLLMMGFCVSYFLAAFYFAILCGFDPRLMLLTLAVGISFALIWGTAAGLVSWLLMLVALPRTEWRPYVFGVLLVMLGYGGVLYMSLADNPNRTKLDALESVLFVGWPLALFACIGMCAAVRRLFNL